MPEKQDEVHMEQTHHGGLFGLYRVFFYVWMFVVVLFATLHLLPVYTEVSEFSTMTLMSLLIFIAAPLFFASLGFGLYGLVSGLTKKNHTTLISGGVLIVIAAIVAGLYYWFGDVIFSMDAFN